MTQKMIEYIKRTRETEGLRRTLLHMFKEKVMNLLMVTPGEARVKMTGR